MYTRRKFGPRPGSVAGALGVQNRANWQVITGSLSAQPEPRETTENPHFRCFAPLSHTVTALASSFPRSYRQDTAMRVSTTTMRLGTLRTRVCAVCATCACVRVCAFVCWNSTFKLFIFLLCLLLPLLLLLLYYLEVCLFTPCHKLSSSLLCGNHSETAVAHQALPFVTATDGASVCARARTMFPMGTNTS